MTDDYSQKYVSNLSFCGGLHTHVQLTIQSIFLDIL